MTAVGFLTSASPARGRATAAGLAKRDIHGEMRKQIPDIGADEFVDSDNDKLPDWWELKYFGNLANDGSGDHDLPQGDRLTNYFEYLFGFDPLKPDTSADGQGDLYKAVFGLVSDSRYPAEWRLDSDSDGLTNGQELYYGTNPLSTDTNGDGISDLIAIFVGINPTSNDTDGDGITNAVEIANGTNPLFADSDGDGVADGVDDFPLDPTRWLPPGGSAGDTTAPLITLIEPVGAVPVP